jgi:twitching motility two-component system response regulator PilG
MSGATLTNPVSGAASPAKSATQRVLVVDDSETIRRSAEIFLRLTGLEVILSPDGFDALSKISDYHPNLILVDIMIPKLDGYQLCQIVKQHPAHADTPVIMLSSKDGVFDRARGRIAGSDEYLTKPFTRDGLLGAVKAHLKTEGAA